MNDTERITLRMPREVHEWLREQSFKTRESINSLIIEALQNQMNQPKKAKDTNHE